MPTFSASIASGTADGNSGTGSGYNNNGGTCQLGGYFGTANGWFLWPGANIPQGSTITACSFTGTKTDSAGTADLIYQFVKTGSAPTYPTSGTDYNGRTLTTATVTQTTSGTGAHTSPSLVSIMQELVNAYAVTDILLFIKDNNSNANHGGFENRIAIKCYDAGGGSYAGISVTYAGAPITADLGTFALTGVAAGIKVNYKITADAGNFALTGVDAGLKVNNSFVSALGTFALTGVAATNSFNSVAAVGVFTLSGIAAGVEYNSAFVSALGTFTLTGFDANFSPTITFIADAAGTNQTDYIIASNWLGNGSGYYVLAIDDFGNTTANINWDGVDPADFVTATQSAIDTLIGAGNCNVTLFDGSGPVFLLLEFTGDYARREIYVAVTTQAAPSGGVILSPDVSGAPAFVLSGQNARIGVDYPLLVDAGAFTFTGIAAGFAVVATLDCDPATFTLTGIAALTNVAIDCSAAAFTLSVNSIRFNEHWPTSAAAGAYTLSGIDAQFVRKIPAAAGAFTLAGIAAGIEYNSRFDIDAGAFTLTGASLGFGTGAILSCSAGAFTLTGIAAGYAGVYTIDADPNAFALTGVAAAFSGVTFAPISAAAGAYTLTGIAAAVTAGRKISGEKATFHLTGIAAGLQRADAFAIGVGAFALTGRGASLGYATSLQSGLGDYVLTGRAARVNVGLRGGAATFTVTRNPANIIANRSIGAGIGTFLLTGNSNAFRFPFVVASGGYSLDGQGATLPLSATVNCAGAFGRFDYVGRAAAIRHSQYIAAGNATFALSGIAAGVKQRAVLDCDNATFALSGIAAGWRTVAILACAPATFTLAGQSAALTWLPVVFGTDAYAEIEGRYSGAVHVSGSYSNTCEVSGSYSARVTLNSVDTVNESFWISEPNDVWLRFYKKASDGVVQASDSPTFSLIDPATDSAVGGIENEPMTCVDAINGHYLGVADPVALPTITRDADYILRIMVSGKVFRELQVTAKVRGSL